MTPQQKYAIGKLVELGWSPVAAAGIVGNLTNEVGPALDPTRSHDGGTGYGIAGWRDPSPGQGRWTNLRNFASERGMPVDSVDTQLEFLNHELQTSEKSVGARLKAATDPLRAGATFIDYERPQGWKRGDATGALGYDNRRNESARLFAAYGAPQQRRAPIGGGTVETAGLAPIADEADLPATAQPTAGEDISDLIEETQKPARNDISDLVAPQMATSPAAVPKEASDFVDKAFADPGRAIRVEDRTKELGRGSGAIDSLAQGVTYGLGDELRAGVRSLQQDTKYGEELDAEREALERYRAEHPYISLGAEIGGAILGSRLLPWGAPVAAANWLQRAKSAAKAGTAVGALYGFGTGEGIEDRATGAVTGGILGGATGGGASVGLDALMSAGRAGINAIKAPFRGIFNPEKEATRRVGSALQRDIGPVPPDLAALGMQNAQRTAPVVVGDMGASTTKSLARSSANTAPEGREALEIATQNRFSGQSGRLEDVLRNITGARGDNAAVRENLEAAARRANKPAYDRAYKDGQVVWSQELADLTSAPAVQQAIRDATTRSRNVAATQGARPIKNPFNVDEATGAVSLKPGMSPSLEFWDIVKRGLNDQTEALYRGGQKSAGNEIKDLTRAFVGHLDSAVPSYAAARQGAAKFFGAENALEAGQEFASKSSMPLNEARRAFNQMSTPEKRLFIEGWTSQLIDTLRRSPDRQDILKRMFNSATERGKAELLLGKQGTRQLESHLRVEGMMEQFRQAVSGNSTTARQLAELGLAGGAGTIVGGGNPLDPKSLMTAALVYGARRGANKIDERVARRVGEMLASSDPQVLKRALETVSKQPALRSALDWASQWIARALPPATPKPDTSSIIGAVAGRADEDEKE